MPDWESVVMIFRTITCITQSKITLDRQLCFYSIKNTIISMALAQHCCNTTAVTYCSYCSLALSYWYHLSFASPMNICDPSFIFAVFASTLDPKGNQAINRCNALCKVWYDRNSYCSINLVLPCNAFHTTKGVFCDHTCLYGSPNLTWNEVSGCIHIQTSIHLEVLL